MVFYPTDPDHSVRSQYEIEMEAHAKEIQGPDAPRRMYSENTMEEVKTPIGFKTESTMGSDELTAV